jgi:hypothetical protein
MYDTNDQLIADVLGRAHHLALLRDAPGEARAILHVAHSLADQLAETDPQFDRDRFMETATKDRS